MPLVNGEPVNASFARVVPPRSFAGIDDNRVSRRVCEKMGGIGFQPVIPSSGCLEIRQAGSLSHEKIVAFVQTGTRGELSPSELSSEASELAVEFGAREVQGGGASVRAVMGIGDEVAARQQRVDLLGSEPLAGLDRSFAAHHVQQAVDEVAPGGVLARRRQQINHVAHDLRRIGARQHARIAGHQDRAASELLDPQSQRPQHIRMFTQQGRFAGGGLRPVAG